MRRILFSIFIFILFWGCGGRDASLYTQTQTAQNTISIKPYFSLTGANYKNGGGVDELIIDDIESANKSIRLAIYGFSNDNIRDAIINAHKRDVDVKVITDDTQLNQENIIMLKTAGIDVVDDQDKSALMHDKFMIIDNNTVWTGSANYGYYAFYKNNENIVKINSSKVAKVYLDEFNEMYTHVYKEGAYISENLEIYFSPEDDFEQRLLDLVEHATKTIDFLAYAFTNTNLTRALEKKYLQGVKIRGVFDKKWNSNKYSQYSRLLSDGINVKLDGNKQTMHNKVFIIDDKIVVTGSYNFTDKANEKNSENVIVVHNKEFADRYEDEFEGIFDLAN